MAYAFDTFARLLLEKTSNGSRGDGDDHDEADAPVGLLFGQSPSDTAYGTFGAYSVSDEMIAAVMAEVAAAMPAGLITAIATDIDADICPM